MIPQNDIKNIAQAIKIPIEINEIILKVLYFFKVFHKDKV